MNKGLRMASLAAIGLYWLMLCVLTHLPVSPRKPWHMGDSTAHFLAFIGLSALLYLHLWVTRPGFRWNATVVLALAMLYALVDERTQPLVGRTCDIMDWMADVAGAAAGVTAMGVIHWGVSLRRGKTGG